MSGNQRSPNLYHQQFSQSEPPPPPQKQHPQLYQPVAQPVQNHIPYHPPPTNGHLPPQPPPQQLQQQQQTLPPAQPYTPTTTSTTRTYYDPVDRGAPDVNAGWNHTSRERTESVHSVHSQLARDPRYNYGEAAVGGAPPPHSPVGLHKGYPLPMPTAAQHHTSEVPPPPLSRGYCLQKEPSPPTAPSSARRGGAMSISALLMDEPGPVKPPQPSKRKAVPEKLQRAAPEPSQITPVYPMHPAPVAAYQDDDETDSETESTMGMNGHQMYQYQTASNADYNVDMERTDSENSNISFEEERMKWMRNLRKRQMELEEIEVQRRKRRRILYQESLHRSLTHYAQQGRNRARTKYYAQAMEQVMAKEEEDERERKKEQQRKRRREKAEIDKKLKAEAAAQAMQDDASFATTLKPRETPLSKARAIDRSVLSEDEVMLDTQDSDFGAFPQEEEPKKIRKKPGPKKGARASLLPKDAAAAEEAEFTKPEPVKDEPYVPHVSKQYNQLYDQIWRDIARKEIPRLARTQQAMLSVKQANLRKTAQLASKEAQRWKLRTTKNIKDTQARAKRCMREMLTFWKRNEREEREMRRRADKEAVERAKREEEKREATRQARKLNFLISQTELYSHFIGRKIKTDDIEKSTGSDNISGSGEIPTATAENGKVPAALEGKPTGEAVTDFEKLDFDDEEALQRAAVNNAHHAIEAARAKAQAFNHPANTPPAPDAMNMDDGEMNFQNPTSLGDVDIEQPKLLSCQLKEYQLKGLNWLCNLYEQGINGILADEMGLGKTVQSISVMAYLAEYHNIWGPFLVVAPASTLHNWQQEIAKFVPAFKAIPYWGNAKDRKTLRRFWDRKSVTYTRDSPMHIVITSYQIVVQDAQYFQRMKWQYMILDEAQAIKSSSSSRWKALLGFHCRNRLLLTGTPIQNSMQELWALLHFIMPSLFDSHDEFSEWFSKDIESHAQSNTQLNEAQLKRLHMILKPFMLRRVKKHVQKELGDKVELDVFCDLTYRQRSIYQNLRAKISVMDLIEKAAMGGDENTATLMNLVMQFRKVCNHPDLFERADIRAPLALTSWGETASFMREGSLVEVPYTARNKISYRIPALVYREGGRLEIPGNDSDAGTRRWVLQNLCSIWKPDYIHASTRKDSCSPFAWLRFSDCSVGEVSATHSKDALERMEMIKRDRLGRIGVAYEEEKWSPVHSMFQIAPMETVRCNASTTEEGVMAKLLNISTDLFHKQRLHILDPMFYDRAAAPPIGLDCLNQGAVIEQQTTLFNDRIRRHLFGPSPLEEAHLIERKIAPTNFPPPPSLPRPLRSDNTTSIEVPSMSRFVTDSGKLATLDRLLTRLKTEGHRVLLYFQMTRMMDLCEEYLTYRHHKYLRLDGSSKLEDRRDMVSAWQTNPDYFVFILSTRAGGLGINLTAADTVIFYDSDWNPTIDSQAMDRAHRLGQTKQVTVYRLITRNTIEERIRMRAQQKEEVQRVVIQGGGSSTKNVDFKGSREVATWLFEDGDAEEMEKRLARKQEEVEAMKAKGKGKGGRKKKEGVAGKGVNIEDMYHEGEGNFDSSKPSEAGTPAPVLPNTTGKKRAKGKGNKKKTTQERLNMIDGTMDVKMGGL